MVFGIRNYPKDVALANRKLVGNRRVILFEGDGSFWLIAQAIGTMIKEKLDIIISLINNEGYTIERWVHGMDAPYNDIPRWKFSEIPSVMGAGNGSDTRTFEVTACDQLETLMQPEDFKKPKRNAVR
ncbi:thiamine diphosphate-binding protein [Halenospora varia]|nr:thiamine diphosphate-binding protein [Halenospora varia]